jgi:hypothetical protein
MLNNVTSNFSAKKGMREREYEMIYGMGQRILWSGLHLNQQQQN